MGASTFRVCSGGAGKKRTIDFPRSPRACEAALGNRTIRIVARPSFFGGSVLAVACSSILAAAACEVVTGLDNLKNETCAGGCDGGGDSTLREDASNDASAPDEAADAAGAMEDDATDSGSEGSDVADAFGDATDATSEGDASSSDGSETKEAEGKDAMGPTDATRETGGKCQSNALAPTGAVASSTESGPGAFPANNAVDGNLGTRWASAPGVDPQWIAIDYGAAVYVDRVQILWETACAVDYVLQISNDMTNWTSFKTVTGNAQGGPLPPDWTTAVDSVGLTAFGRYLRVYGTKRCTMFGYSIWEMRAFGDTDATCHP